MKFSIIFPIKNQTDMFVKNLNEKVIPYFETCGHVFDIIIVPNGSSEEEQAKLEKELSSMPPYVKMLPFSKIGAKGAA
ncbi:MAG: hypothetical protein PUJ84_06820, partial [Mollicutes bacterium]|nr:hypothetical protein [Mollicutes bacterium]